jgi:hypothetical protein
MRGKSGGVSMTYSDLSVKVAGCVFRIRADAAKNLCRRKFLLLPACVTRSIRPQATFTERYERSFRPSLQGSQLKLDNAFWSLHEGPSKIIITIKPTARHGRITAVLNPTMDQGDIYLADQNEEWLTTRLWRLLTDNVLSRNGVFELHASAIIDRGTGYVFFGPSGAGKSTIARLWARQGATIIHDDKVMLRKIRGRVIVSSAAIVRKSRSAGSDGSNSAQVRKIFFLKHGNKNMVSFMSQRSILKKLASQSRSLIWDGKIWKKIAGFYADLSSSIAGYQLEFLPDVRCVELIRRHQ